MHVVNIGILAHIDAGKTSLTERILFETGVIAAPGSVDKGTTQTDSMELERQRGITIQSAVVSFTIGDLKVNLIDTPGHPDFIAEVERALGVVDGVVVVVSAVEGVQAQTRRMVRAITASGTPLILFVNKIDRVGARDASLIQDIRQKLGLRVVPLSTVTDLGTREARSTPRSWSDRRLLDEAVETLTENSDALLNAWVDDPDHLEPAAVRDEFVSQVHGGLVSPLYFGSAVHGLGVDQLLEGIATFLPAARSRHDDPLHGSVFKIHRDRSGEKIVLARLFTGNIASRQHIPIFGPREDEISEVRITAVDRFENGAVISTREAGAGEIVRLHGLREVRIGDRIGSRGIDVRPEGFSPPALESVVRPVDPALRTRLNESLAHLSEQDPLITIRRDERHDKVSVLLYGEVQKEVIASRLEQDFGVAVAFEQSHVVCVERVTGCGEAAEFMGSAPFMATIGLRVEPATPGSGIVHERELGALPLSFYKAIEETVYETFEEGLLGWAVQDCRVTLTEAGFCAPASVAGDFRKLTPLVLMAALQQAGTQVCEPIQRFTIDVPLDCTGEVSSALGAARAVIRHSEAGDHAVTMSGTIPTAEVNAFERRLPGISHGEGDIDVQFDSYAPVPGIPPSRPRTDFNPLNRKLYLAQVSQA